MTTATKRSPKAATKNRRKQPAARTLKKQTVEPMDIPVGQIAPSPFQPRQDFASAEIDALAKSIEAVGQVQPITVRPMSAGYELIDGERRWRAVKALGHKTIRAEVAEHTDAQVRAMVLASAMQRQDLNPIEEARAFRQMIDAGDAKGPTALAKLVGLSQGHISNRLRLLELPDWWQREIISREIPATHVRAVMPHKDHPLLMDAITKDVQAELSNGNHETVDEFSDTVDHAVRAATRPLDGSVYKHPKRGWDRALKPTAKQRKELQVVSVGTEQRAANVTLWDLQAEWHQSNGNGSAKAKPSKKAAKIACAKCKQRIEDRKIGCPKCKASFDKTTIAPAVPDAPPATLDPAKLWGWYIRWLRWLIARQLRGFESDATETDLLLLMMALRGELDNNGHRDAYWVAAFKTAGVKVKRSGAPKTIDIAKSLDAGSPNDVFDVAAAFLASLLYNQTDGPFARIDDGLVLTIAKSWDINLETEWGFLQGGPLTKEFWSMHSKEELVALAAELDVTIKPPAGKNAIVKAFMDRIPPEDATEIGLDYPSELKRIKPPKPNGAPTQ